MSKSRPSARILTATIVALCAGTLVPPAAAQAPAAAQPAQEIPNRPQNESRLSEFVHYVNIDQRQAAVAVGQQLLESGLTPEQFVLLVDRSQESTRFADALIRAQRQEQVSEVAAALQRMYEQGRLAMVRNPDEIRRNIAALTGQPRAWMLARERLIAAGEYAMPLMLEALRQRNDPALRAAVFQVMVDMGRQVINPLVAALPHLDEGGQELVVDVLGRVQYATSVPYLADLRARTKSAPVRAAVDRALSRIGVDVAGATPAELYLRLADRFYRETQELTSFPGEDHQLLWSFEPAVGLYATPVNSRVYHEAMAMRTSEQSLRLQAEGNREAVALWIAANLKREIESPEGYQNPTYGADRRDAEYFAVASGADIVQRVLARALLDRNTPLARRAIAALDQTAGGPSLWETQEGRSAALLAALTYPNRRVRYDAALALGKANPDREFTGSDRVVPILGSLVRDVSERYAVVITPDAEVYQTLRRVLEPLGYTVLPNAGTLRELAGPIAETPGIDLVVARLSPERTADLVTEVRATPAVAATPVLALTTQEGAIELARLYDRDSTVSVRPQGIEPEQMRASIDDLIERAAGGPITPEESREYRGRALGVLRDLAVSGNSVFPVGQAAGPLIRALLEGEAVFRHEVAEVLSWVDQKRAQVALMDAALNSEGEERIALLAKVADSAKRHSNMLDPRQVRRLVELARTADDAEATAAAAVMGALNLPNADLIPLILDDRR